MVRLKKRIFVVTLLLVTSLLLYGKYTDSSHGSLTALSQDSSHGSLTALSQDSSHGSLTALSQDSSLFTAEDDSITEEQRLSVLKAIEDKYSHIYSSLTDSDIKSLTGHYNHDISLYWSSKGQLHNLVPKSRPLPDLSCQKHRDKKFKVPVSVVICHRNELSYSLFRTVNAIDRHTPRELLKEIIIIDDGSYLDNSTEISEFGKALKVPIKTYRNTKSIGISRCRYDGIRKAEGDVVALLDSHMEVSDLWLQPLLDILTSKPKSIAVPLVDMLNEYRYTEALHYPIKPYTYELTFGYSLIHWSGGGPGEEDKSRPFSSPSLGGGGVVAYKSTLLTLYPTSITEKYLWGVENNRLGLRAWMCGDGVWISACSQVTHLSGPDLALKRYGGFFNMRDELGRESLAEIVNFFGGQVGKDRMLDRTFFGDEQQKVVYEMAEVIARDFDHKKQCVHNYDWYVKHVHTSIHYKYFESEDFLHVGEIQSYDGVHCLHCIILGSDGVFTEPSCRAVNTVFWDTHLFGFAANGAVYTSNPDILCWDAGEIGERVRIAQYPCHSRSLSGVVQDSQRFVYDETTGQIKHTSSNRCVELVKDKSKTDVLLMNCKADNLQKWSIHRPKWLADTAVSV